MEYSDRSRQPVRNQSEPNLRADLCFMFHPCFVTFNEARREAAHNSDTTIDYIPPQPTYNNDDQYAPQVNAYFAPIP